MGDAFDATAENDALALHIWQAEAGLIPAGSPPGFTLPQAVDERGLPWFYGPSFSPTPEALATARREWEERQERRSAE